MSEFTTIGFDEFVERVQDTLQRPSPQPGAAYTLLLGAGMSVPLVPTATQMVLRDIPWWLMWRKDNPQSGAFPDTPPHNEDLGAYARQMWKEVHQQTGDFELSDDTGLPKREADNIGRAYQVVMSGRARSGLSTPEQQRWYLRDVVSRIKGQMNMGHLALASILREQSRDEYLERYTRPFCNTIFTTNFDNLLQRSLQMVNQLYYMTDRPELGLPPPDDSVENAVHLVYTHGNIYRYYLANTPAVIRKLAEENASTLMQYFARHGVIAMGYSGWSDTTMTALKGCSGFDGNLYWCDIQTPAQAETGGLRKDVVELLTEDRDHRFYVQLPRGGADRGMRDLHKGLDLGTCPQVLFDPLRGLIEELEGVHLPESADSDMQPMDEGLKTEKFSLKDMESSQDILSRTVTILKNTRGKHFIFEEEMTTTPEDTASDVEAEIAKFMNQAHRASLEHNFERAIAILDVVISMPELTPEQKVRTLVNRGAAKILTGYSETAIEDFDEVLNILDAPYEQKVRALVHRGLAKYKANDSEGAIADFTEVLEMPDASAEQKVRALVNRGAVKVLTGHSEAAIADYNEVLNMPDAPSEQKVRALVHRGAAKNMLENPEGALEDYKKAVELSPENLTARYNMACMEAQLDNPGKAVEALEKWRELDPEANRNKLDVDCFFDSIREHPDFVAFRETLPE